MPRSHAFTWSLSEVHGWGLLGVHTALYLVELGRPPLLLEEPLWATLRPCNREALGGLKAGFDQIRGYMAQYPDKRFDLADHDVLHGLSNGFFGAPVSGRFRGRRNIGVIAYEDTRLTPEVVARARAWDFVVVHSEFNRRLLADKGVPDVRVALQGIDPTEIQPGRGTGQFGDRFVVFSGGKLEFRKGQDIVLAAFRAFRQRHPEALLVTAWHNAWPATARSMAESRVVAVAPEIGADNRLRITAWAEANGVPADSFIDLGFVGRDRIAAILGDCHAAVFPNRCEGATNLVAMETLACAVPTVLSANTGHHDIIREGCGYVLTRQAPVVDPDGSRIGWGETDVEELVERLEEIHADRAEARARADRGAAFIQGERTWRHFAEVFVAEIDRA